MNYDEQRQFDEVKREIKEIWSHLFGRKSVNATPEVVTLTSAGSSPSFTYSFTAADGSAFSAIVPTNSGDREGVDILAAGKGIWFPDGAGSGKLMVKEKIDWAGCT